MCISTIHLNAIRETIAVLWSVQLLTALDFVLKMSAREITSVNYCVFNDIDFHGADTIGKNSACWSSCFQSIIINSFSH